MSCDLRYGKKLTIINPFVFMAIFFLEIDDVFTLEIVMKHFLMELSVAFILFPSLDFCLSLIPFWLIACIYIVLARWVGDMSTSFINCLFVALALT